MSISSEINRIEGAKSDIADAIEDMGVTVPSGTKIDGLATLIRSGVNGHIQDTSNPHQVTAGQAGAISKLPDHLVTGSSGWYRFYTKTIGLSTTHKFCLLVTETQATIRTAIIAVNCNRLSSSSADATCVLNLVASAATKHDEFAYSISGGAVSLYYKKASNSNGGVAFQVLYSENRQGTTYVDMTDFWENVSVTLPSGSVYANSIEDGSGNVIKDTYALKPPYKTITFSQSWSGSGPYTQTVTVTGATVTSNSSISLQPTADQIAQLISDGVQAITIENNAGTLTAYALGTAPSTAMTIACTVIEVAS